MLENRDIHIAENWVRLINFSCLSLIKETRHFQLSLVIMEFVCAVNSLGSIAQVHYWRTRRTRLMEQSIKVHEEYILLCCVPTGEENLFGLN